MNFVFLFIAFISSTWAEPKFSNESEAGAVATTGNSQSDNYNIRVINSLSWVKDTASVNGRFLKGSADGKQTAFKWGTGARYERSIDMKTCGFVAQDLDSDRFAGYNQRYASDLGVKYYFLKDEEWNLDSELGYRYSEDNRVDDTVSDYHSARLYTEIQKTWVKNHTVKWWIEYIPRLTSTTHFLFNSELSVSSVLTTRFSIKSAYQLKYNNVPDIPTAVKTDAVFTTSLVAKF
jgi:putative salt-induced outer membrane protein